uniref:Uncharacterized protein n=1 Tax=Solanum lycopersicum TaxID=4081 RepID=K4DG96_SOLLC
MDGHLVPFGALILFVQKGIQYLKLETNLSIKNCDYLLSCRNDTVVVVSNVKSGELKHLFDFYSELFLDVASRNNDSFATSNAYNMIYACKAGENKPVKAFSRHPDINTIKWSPIAAGTSNLNHHMMFARYPISCYVHINSFFHMWW